MVRRACCPPIASRATVSTAFVAIRHARAPAKRATYQEALGHARTFRPIKTTLELAQAPRNRVTAQAHVNSTMARLACCLPIASRATASTAFVATRRARAPAKRVTSLGISAPARTCPYLRTTSGHALGRTNPATVAASANSRMVKRVRVVELVA